MDLRPVDKKPFSAVYSRPSSSDRSKPRASIDEELASYRPDAMSISEFLSSSVARISASDRNKKSQMPIPLHSTSELRRTPDLLPIISDESESLNEAQPSAETKETLPPDLEANRRGNNSVAAQKRKRRELQSLPLEEREEHKRSQNREHQRRFREKRLRLSEHDSAWNHIDRWTKQAATPPRAANSDALEDVA